MLLARVVLCRGTSVGAESRKTGDAVVDLPMSGEYIFFCDLRISLFQLARTFSYDALKFAAGRVVAGSWKLEVLKEKKSTKKKMN